MLDAAAEAYHNPAAVWWGAFAPSTIMSPWTTHQARPVTKLLVLPVTV